jgi:hypothetical protein
MSERDRRRWVVLVVGMVAMTAGCTFQYGLAAALLFLATFPLAAAALVPMGGEGRVRPAAVPARR